MKSKIIVVTGIAVIVIIGLVVMFGRGTPQTGTTPTESIPPRNDQAMPSDTSAPESSATASPVSSSPKQFTLADIALHANGQSCYTAINGKVYDLTAWISEHPGGEQAILSICGKDGSDAFNAQHGGQARPERELANFLIGDLK